jgi:hypothetical protein
MPASVIRLSGSTRPMSRVPLNSPLDAGGRDAADEGALEGEEEREHRNGDQLE